MLYELPPMIDPARPASAADIPGVSPIEPEIAIACPPKRRTPATIAPTASRTLTLNIRSKM
jgi:hypothetical protein